MSAASQKAAVLDNRAAPRERVMLVAKLSFNHGAVSVDCMVSNISRNGARLSVSQEFVLAQSMRLSVPQREMDIPVRLVWRRGNVAAVAFETAAPRANETAAPAREKSLEEENRRLRILLVEMEQRLKRMQEGL
jgi:hypothetical protein